MATLKKFRVKKDMGGYSYPYTHMDLVFDDNNQNLTEKLNELTNAILNGGFENGGGSLDVTGLATETYVLQQIEALRSDVDADIEEIYTGDINTLFKADEAIHERIDGVATDVTELYDIKLNKSDMPTIPTKVTDLENDAGYMTGIPSNYVTEDMLQNKGYMTNIPEEYATKDYVQNQISGALKIQQVTQSQYDEMVTKEPNTLYIIIDD